MTVNGIIAEYNPFHNGHKFQMEEAARISQADYTVIVMSGNFVQRGSPALLDKHKRAEAALRCGADLVLELPTLYAASSAEYFGAGSVALLDKLGVITHLCFGSECGDTSLLTQIAEILVKEPPEYSSTMKRLLQQGLSYPNARTWALMQNYPFLCDHKKVFSSPNNILGIEYIKALIRRESDLIPLTVQRTGAGYHDRETGGDYCSSLAIRQALYTGGDPVQLCHQMPEEAGRLLTRHLAKNNPVRTNDFSQMLHYKLLLDYQKGYDSYQDVSSDLSDRIKKRLNEFKSFESFCDLLKTKEMTYTRISRCLFHILLNITKEDMDAAKEIDYIPYARVLGFRKNASPLLTAIKESSSVPLITKLADAEKILDEFGGSMLNQDIMAGRIYQSASHFGQPQISEYAMPLVIV